MTVQDIKDYIKNKISNINTNEQIYNYKRERTGQQISWWKGEDVINELTYILSMLDQLDEPKPIEWKDSMTVEELKEMEKRAKRE